jgi:macrophage erythroblast attacher
MTELTTTKLNPESHLILVRSPLPSQSPILRSVLVQDQPLLRLPHEIARKNFKTVQKNVEREKDVILSSLKSTANASLAGQDANASIASLDTMISRMQGLKRKMESLREEERVMHQHSRRRILHLQDLYEIPSLADVKYEEWSRVRLDRLLVDYLLRSGYGNSAMALAREKGIEELVDLDVFVQCHAIEESLRRRSTAECLAWCAEHRPLMKKSNV